MRMRFTPTTCWLPLLAAIALALAVGGVARADVCVVVTPGLDLGCREGQAAPVAAGPAAAVAAREEEPAIRSSTVVPYDPRRVAVTFKPGVTRARARAVISGAGGTLEAAIPQIRAYLVGVDPGGARLCCPLCRSRPRCRALRRSRWRRPSTRARTTPTGPSRTGCALRGSPRRGT